MKNLFNIINLKREGSIIFRPMQSSTILYKFFFIEILVIHQIWPFLLTRIKFNTSIDK